MTTTIGSLDLNAFSNLYSDSTQYFWFEGNASATYGAGVHVTLVPDTSFIANPTGQNILINTDGLSIRNGVLPMMTLDNNSLDFNVVNTSTSTYTNVASFGSTTTIGISDGTQSYIEVNTVGMNVYSGNNNVAFFGSNARIGENASGKSRTEIGTAGMQIYQNVNGTDTQIANLGYGAGNNSSGGTSNAPYYTFGVRTGTVGNYSTAEGYNAEASGYISHAEGDNTEASGIYGSHAEGKETIASGRYGSHAEGQETIASGDMSHAEGQGSIASGQRSHAEGSSLASGYCSHSQNNGTIASSDSQTTLGKFNIEDNANTYAVIIGNGTAANARSNALTVDWLGGIQMYLDSNGTSSSSATSGTDMDLFNAIYDLGWYSDVIV